MNRFLELWGATGPGGIVHWFPVAAYRLRDVGTTIWKNNVLPFAYGRRVMVEYDPFVGCKVIAAEGHPEEWVHDMLDPVLRLDVAEPLLAEAICAMIPTNWQRAWTVPLDPTPQVL